MKIKLFLCLLLILFFSASNYDSQKIKEAEIDKIIESEALSLEINCKLNNCVKGNCIDGYGECVDSNSRKYKGNWKNNLRDGEGYYESSSEEFHGKWKNDKSNGFGIYKITYHGGITDIFIGEWKNSKREGFGVEIQFKENMKNPIIETGTWENNKFIGDVYRVSSADDLYKMILESNGKYKIKKLYEDKYREEK